MGENCCHLTVSLSDYVFFWCHHWHEIRYIPKEDDYNQINHQLTKYGTHVTEDHKGPNVEDATYYIYSDSNSLKNQQSLLLVWILESLYDADDRVVIKGMTDYRMS